ncbi:MAG: hypothetical protein NC117_08175 [Pseudoflavonifractor sp.]|nr:hypothetical protein [Pseudoflavonifractor sp.]
MRTIVTLIIGMMAIAAHAQTYYYAHTKTVYADGRVVEQNGQSGQFVCRTSSDGPKRCFDSTSTGRNHLNGTLYYVGKYNGADEYHGKSYYGENSIYQFNDSRGLLNIKDARGNVYVYKRREAPAGRKNSSLLAAGASRDGWDARDGYVDPIQPVTPTPNPKPKPNNPGTTRSRECGYCHGGGRVKAHVGTSSYGTSNRRKKCGTCGQWYDTATDHWHDCPQCKGTGRL